MSTKSFHNLKYIEKVASVGGRTAEQNLHGVSTNDMNATEYNISDLYSLVKQHDKDFHAGKEINPALLNKDGTPRILYHRTNNDFTVFDTSKSGNTNKIATVFGRNDFYNYINKEIRNGNLVKIKNISTQTSELTAPIADSYSKNASNNSISNPAENVNKKFSDRDAEYLELARNPEKNEAK